MAAKKKRSSKVQASKSRSKATRRDQVPAEGGWHPERASRTSIVLGVIGLLIVIAITGLWGTGHTQLGDFLSAERTVNVLRAGVGAVIVVATLAMTLGLRARSAEEGDSFVEGYRRAISDPLNKRNWTQVLLLIVLGAVLIVWGVAELV